MLDLFFLRSYTVATMQAPKGKVINKAKQSVLLDLFNSLDEADKDAVIQLSESLVAKHRNKNQAKGGSQENISKEM